MSTTIVEF